MTPNILRIALPTPLRRLFDYLPPEGINVEHFKPGLRILVPFQSRQLVGVLIEVDQESSVPRSKLKPALEVLDRQPLFTPDVYKLCLWAAAYYQYSLGEVLLTAMPACLRKAKPITLKPKKAEPRNVCSSQLPLNSEQQYAVKEILAAKNQFKIFMLDGITGSGKTEVYLQTIDDILKRDQQILVLVPEISLTPQTVARFKDRFSVPIAALHSNLSDKERYRAWLEARSGEVQIVIGTRSAIFTPFKNLGLMIVDEEHDNSFKQQDRFRYHARDLAVMRASHLQIPVVLGSATPSLESVLNVKRNRYNHLVLRERAGGAQLPTYQIIDLSQEKPEEGLSKTLIQAMQEAILKKQQVMLFLNRRGYAPVLYCPACAWVAECKRCDARLVYHRSPPRLHCHHCDARMSVPRHCAHCQSTFLETLGVGTQRLEQVLGLIFKDVPIIRVDRDSTQRKGALEKLLAQVHTLKPAILLGTQMLAKGHHFPHVTLVGIIDADTGLFSADFRAAEQMGQLLMQVSGRAGRADKAGSVIIQTKHPDHPLLQLLLTEGYSAFSQHLLEERARSSLPPYTYFAIFRAEALKEESAHDFLLKIKNLTDDKSVTALGPVPAMLAKRKGMHCQHLILKTSKRKNLQDYLQQMLPKVEKIPNKENVKWILDVDPLEI